MLRTHLRSPHEAVLVGQGAAQTQGRNLPRQFEKMGESTVPITRDLLREFYAEHPLEPLREEVASLREEMESYLREHEEKTRTFEPESLKAPHKIDENYFRMREKCEEVAFLLRKQSVLIVEGERFELEPLASGFDRVERAIQDMQKGNTEYVSAMVAGYLPQDFRGSLIRQQKERTELNREKEVKALVDSGASIKEKYELLWKQQMDRREALAQLGHATGMYKALVTYIGGVPQVLLDFIKEINAEGGPMEEQRITYGPTIYSLTEFVSVILLFAACFVKNASSKQEATKCFALLSQACTVFMEEDLRVLEFMGALFRESPFLVSTSKSMGSKYVCGTGQYIDLSIVAGDGQEVVLDVHEAGTCINWEFTSTGGDVGFSVEFHEKEGHRKQLIPLSRQSNHEGRFVTSSEGKCKLLFDNSHSYFYSKQVRYMASAIPPLGERNS